MMTQKPQQKPAQPSRMTLASVTRGKIERPPKVLMYGPEGCGKTTWAANAPAPIFLCAENGTEQLDVSRFPEPETWADVLAAVDVLTNEEHPHQTLVIDTLDWLEPICWKHVCRRDGKDSIEDYGFSKGQKTVAPAEWRVLLARLERMRSVKNMGVILIAHSTVRSFKSPDMDDFGRYELAIEPTSGGVMKQWCDAVLFARYEEWAQAKDKKSRARGMSSGARLVHTQRSAAFDAKNRFDLPETMPLDWHAFEAAVKAHKPAEPSDLRAGIEKLLEQAPDMAERVRAAVAKAGEDAPQLARIADHLSAQINIKNGEVSK